MGNVFGTAEKYNFKEMLEIAKGKTEEQKKIASTNTFRKNFASAILDEYEALYDIHDSGLAQTLKKQFFKNMARVCKRNPSLTDNADIKKSLIDVIDSEYKRSCAEFNETRTEYRHVYPDGQYEIIGLFNQLFKTKDADKDAHLKRSAKQFFRKELKDPEDTFIRNSALLSLCANKNFVKDEELRDLVVGALFNQRQELDNEDIEEGLTNEEERKQFVKTINAIPNKIRGGIITQEKKQAIEEIIPLLSRETESSAEHTEEKESPKKKLSGLGCIGNADTMTQSVVGGIRTESNSRTY